MFKRYAMYYDGYFMGMTYSLSENDAKRKCKEAAVAKGYALQGSSRYTGPSSRLVSVERSVL
jgi:hypothetical protein